MTLLVFLVLATLSTAVSAELLSAVVVVPVADVWSRPLAPGEKPSDELRETQILLGEKVLIHESSGTWEKIEAVEQPEYTHRNTWEGYPGWVSKRSLGHRGGRKAARNLLGPEDIIQFVENKMGTPYLWGGLSKSSGFDCSGLVHLAYRQNWKQIPRDAHEQWMKAIPILRADLKPADLIFSAKADQPKKITHVSIYAGDGQIIEAPQTGMVVRKVSFKEKYDKAFEDVESGEKVGERVIYFGSFLQK